MKGCARYVLFQWHFHKDNFAFTNLAEATNFKVSLNCKLRRKREMLNWRLLLSKLLTERTVIRYFGDKSVMWGN